MAGRRLTERILDLVEEQEKKSGSGQTRRTVTRPMVVFPEGTTSNGSFLLSFKTGAFRAGHPVLPVLFQYRAVTVHPGWESITFKNHLGKLITAPWNRVAVHTLPTYYPSEAEQHDAKLYANNVHKFMVEYSRGYPETFGAAGLLASTASFKLVAGGGQFFNQANRFESWGKFPAEQQAMRRWLDESRIPGVIFLSGDRHFAELLRIERPGRYPLHELTTSPLTASPVRHPDAAERNNPDLVPGTLVNERNFALLTVSGPRTDRRLLIELNDTQGKTLWEWGVKASALV